MKDYVNRFLVALYESEYNENCEKWTDVFSWEIKEIVSNLTYWEEWWDKYCEFPTGSDIFKLLIHLEWMHIGNFYNNHEQKILPKYPAKCFDIAWELHQVILEKLIKNHIYKMGD